MCHCFPSDANVGHDNAKLGLFIAAALGIVALMGMVYCIYMQFYTKHQYLHTQLHEDSGNRTNSFSILIDHFTLKHVGLVLEPLETI